MSWLIKKDDARPITVRVIDADAAPVAGLTLTSTWKWTKGSTQGNAAGTLAEAATGVYQYTPTAGEVDTLGNASLTFSDTTNGYISVGGGVQVIAVDPRDAVRAGLTALPNANAGTSTGLATAQTIARTLTGAAAVYYVAKSGNDSNDGLSPATAKLTIGSALSAASAGDTIRIASGTYTEKLDLSSKANITLQGDGKSAVITQSSGGDAQNDYIVKVGNGSTLRNLTLTQAYAGTQGATFATAIYGSGVSHVLIDDVYISSTDSGILIYDGRNTTIRNSRLDCSEIGMNLATGESSGLIDGCTIRCTNWTYCSAYAITLGGGGMGNNSYVIRNTRAYVNRADYTGGQPYAIEVFGAHVVAQNCVFAAELGVAEGALPAQKVIAVLLNNNAGAGYEFASCLLLDGCVLSSIDGNGDVGTHIYNTDSYSTVYATGTTIYDRSNIVGTVTDLTYTAASAASTAATNTGTLAISLAALALKFSGITSIANWIRAGLRKSSPDATAIAEINDGGGTYDPTTDSPEAIRDRGDAAWTGTGLTAQDVRNAQGLAYTGSSSAAVGSVDKTLTDILRATNTIGGGKIIHRGPVTSDGHITIVRGDDYNVASGQPLEWTDTGGSWPTLTGASISFTARVKNANGTIGSVVMTTAGSVVTGSGANKKVRVEPLKAATGALTPGNRNHRFDVQATLSTGEVITLVMGEMTVLEDITT